MTKRIRYLLVAAAAVISGIAVTDSAPVSADGNFGAIGAILTGEQEVPGPGDADGIGAAGMVVSVRESGARVCYILGVKKIAPATAAHIHRGAVGVQGDVVVMLDAPRRGFSANCASVDSGLAGELISTPEQFYVNVHNADFPAGAIRGQLH
jgi:hypothetical protein